MSLIDKLKDTWLGFRGLTPPLTNSSSPNSTLHNTSSINNNPSINRKPSSLDRNGTIPTQYRDTAPTGARI